MPATSDPTQFGTSDVEWDNSTSLDYSILLNHGIDPCTASWRKEEMPLDKVHGNFGTFESYAEDEGPYMQELVEAHQQGDLPPVAFVKRGERYYHVDGAHRLLVARHLGEHTLLAYVTDASS